MREKDIKILWGRSGNRCAICKIELTPDGDRETLGEMAHIVGRSNDGPRGNDDLAKEDRDKYANLILLCPTHHTEIDKNTNDWPKDRLLKQKADHESWVSSQLENGQINIFEIDNSNFLASRRKCWFELCDGEPGLALSLTPLRIIRQQIDALSTDSKSVINRARVKSAGYEPRVNRNNTRPTEFGLVNKRAGKPSGLDGYSFHLFDSGHCEAVFPLASRVARFAEQASVRTGDTHGAKILLRYTDVAELICSGIDWLKLAWEEVLPFEYMDFRVILFSAKYSNIYSNESDWGEGIFGYPIESDFIEHKDVVRQSIFSEETDYRVLSWLSNCYGLKLSQKLDLDGNLKRPEPFS